MRRRSPLAWAGVLVVLGIALRVGIGTVAVHPGHADQSYYYGLAEQLSQGGGWTPRYIWHYLNAPDLIGHLPNDYWMPLTPLVFAAPMTLFGTSLGSVFVVTFLAAGAIGVLTFLLARRLCGRDDVALASTALVMFHPELVRWSLVPETPILFTAFALFALYAVHRAQEDARWWLWAGAAVGLANLTRQDGLLLVAAVLAAAVILHRRAALGPAARVVGSYSAVMAPLWISNMAIHGAPLPSNLATVSRLVNYEQLFAVGYSPSLSEYLDLGWSRLASMRIRSLDRVTSTTFDVLSPVLGSHGGGGLGRCLGFALLALAVFGAWRLRSDRRAWSVALVAGGGYLLIALFHVLVLPVVSGAGGTMKTAVFLVPVVTILAAYAASVLLEGRAFTVAVGASLLVMVPVSVSTGLAPVRENNEIGEHNLRVASAVRERFSDPVVMTRNPWELEVIGGVDAVQIPNEPPEGIVDMACRLDVDVIVNTRTRPQLEELRLDSVVTEDETTLLLFRCPDDRG